LNRRREPMRGASEADRINDAEDQQQRTSSALVQLALVAPPEVGRMQRRTAGWLLRPYPIGLRFSGSNMSPIPCWLSGAQHAALNMSPINGQVDLAVNLHFALFNGSNGFLLKPAEMLATLPPAEILQTSPCADVSASCSSPQRSASSVLLRVGSDVLNERSTAPLSAEPPTYHRVRKAASAESIMIDDVHQDDANVYWPPAREWLHRTSIQMISLHNLPHRGEQRPCCAGRRGACHDYLPELTGSAAPPPADSPVSDTRVLLSLSLHPIGGFCAVSRKLPLQQIVDTNIDIAARDAGSGGINVAFDEGVHCIAAEPHAVFFRIGVSNGRSEVAFESAVLGRLRRGYRCLQLRSLLGTKIELCHLLVHVDLGSEVNVWQTIRQQTRQLKEQQAAKRNLTKRIAELEAAVARSGA